MADQPNAAHGAQFRPVLVNDLTSTATTCTMAMKDEETSNTFLDTLEGELAFFRSLMRARPVGIHRHFHAMVIRNAIQRDTGRWVPMDDIWGKLRACYDIDLLESIVRMSSLARFESPQIYTRS